MRCPRWPSGDAWGCPIPLVTGSGAPFPGRAEILFLAFCVAVGTLLLHGLTLPWVIRRLGVEGRESYHDARAEADAMYAATQAALQRLEAVSEGAPELVTTQLRKAAEHRSHSVWERLVRPQTELGEAPSVITAGYGGKCSPPSARRWWPYATVGVSTMKSFPAPCVSSI